MDTGDGGREIVGDAALGGGDGDLGGGDAVLGGGNVVVGGGDGVLGDGNVGGGDPGVRGGDGDLWGADAEVDSWDFCIFEGEFVEKLVEESVLQGNLLYCVRVFLLTLKMMNNYTLYYNLGF